MKPRWLLLAVGVVCLLVLAPAAALSQEGTEIACGSAVIDGTVGTAEWADATVLPMKGDYGPVVDNSAMPRALGAGPTGQVQPAQDGEEAEGWLYLKNDQRYLYVGATMMDIGEENPDWWGTALRVGFSDEPCGDAGAWVDDEWEKDFCEDLPGEGWLDAGEGQYGEEYLTDAPYFTPASEDLDWCGAQWADAQGVVAKGGRHTVHYEMRIDLEGSELNCAGPGDCLRFYVRQLEEFCDPAAPQCADSAEYWTQGQIEWPAFVSDDQWQTPDDFGTICLNPCEVEFVPEPGTMLLLGSGLLSLAGYAGLRRRARS